MAVEGLIQFVFEPQITEFCIHHTKSPIYEWVNFQQFVHLSLTGTNAANSMKQSLFGKLKVPQLVTKSLCSHRTRSFITVFARAYHMSLSWDARVQPTPSYL